MSRKEGCLSNGRTRRAGRPRKQIEAMGGIVGVGPECPPEIEERFLEQVLACELEEDGPALLEHLRGVGVRVPQPEQLDEADLSAKLREVIDGLARLRVYLSATDHLSDRELYLYLWEDMLRQPISISDDPNSAWHFDVIGGWSEADVATYLRYYADAEERSRWAEDFPEMTIPCREKPPFDRDRHLPQAPWDRLA